MARPLELRVDGNSKGAAAALEAAAREMDRAAREADRLGRAFDDAKRDAEQLDRELAKNALAVKALAHEYRTADVEIRKDIKKRLDAERSAGAELRKVRSEIIGDTERESKAATAAFAAATKDRNRIAGRAEKDAKLAFEKGLKDAAKSATKAGKESASAFSDGFRGFLTSPQGIAALGITGALAAIPALAAVGGATLAVAGAGAAGLAGFAAAKNDTSGRVAGAGQNLAGDLKAQFNAGGRDAIGPLLGGINELRAAVKDIHLDTIIREGAKYIGPLARGAGQFAGYLSDAAESLTKGAGPAIKVLANELPEVGRSIAIAADDIAQGSEGGAKGLKTLLQVTEGVIVGTGKFIRGAEDAYDAITNFGHGLESTIAHLRDTNGLLFATLAPADALLTVFDPNRTQAFAVSLDGAAHGLDGIDESATPAASSIGAVSQAMKDLNGEVSTFVGNALSLDQSNIQIAQDFADLKKNLKGVGDKLDINTQKGRDNREVLDGLVGDLERQREAAITAGGGTQEAFDKANKTFQDQIAKAEALAVKLGIDKKAAHDYFAQFRDISFTITEIHKTQFTTSGQRQTGSSRFGGRGEFALGGIRHAAAGMLIPPSDPGTTLVGEPQTGGEVLIPRKGISRARALGLAQVVGDGYGFDAIPRSGSGRSIASVMGSGGAVHTVRVELVPTTAGGSAAVGVAALVADSVRSGHLMLRAVGTDNGNGVPVKVA